MAVILFDLDGTLTNPREGITNSVKHALKEMKKKIPSEKKLDLFIGPPLKESFVKFCEMTQEEADRAVDLYRDYFSEKGLYENIPYEGIEAVLSSLKKGGHKLVVATSKPTVFAVKILEKFKLAKFFDHIQGSELDGTGVDKEEVIRNALSAIEAKNLEQVIMIGDREHDIIGAKKVGITSVGVLYGYGEFEELDKAGADELVDDLEELLEILEDYLA